MTKYLCYNISEITYRDAIYGKWFKSLYNRKKYDLISRDQDIKSYRSFGYDRDTNIIHSLDIYFNNTTL